MCLMFVCLFISSRLMNKNEKKTYSQLLCQVSKPKRTFPLSTIPDLSKSKYYFRITEKESVCIYLLISFNFYALEFIGMYDKSYRRFDFNY